jgi:hypothetical protein
MKQFLFLLLLCPLLSAAQDKSRFENDTLYTSCGFKIYKGQTLQFGKGTSYTGFRYIKIKNGVPPHSLENTSIIVNDLSNYEGLIMKIDVTGSIIYKDGSKGTVALTIAFDQAIGTRLPGTISELVLPVEFEITKEKAAALYMPFFVDDTLYTSCGYKIYKGQVLQFGNLTGNKGRFRYVNIKNKVSPSLLQNNQVTVTEIKDFGISALGNSYITIIGIIIGGNNQRGEIEMHMAFDHAIGNSPSVPGELLVPDEFRNKLR